MDIVCEDRGDMLIYYKHASRRDNNNATVFIVIHGGAWLTGSPNTMDNVCSSLSKIMNAVCVAPIYTLSSLEKSIVIQLTCVEMILLLLVILVMSRRPRKYLAIITLCIALIQSTAFLTIAQSPVHYPVQVLDICNNIKWVIDNIQTYGGDPENIFLLGYSAGAHIAALIGLNDIYLSKVDVPRTSIKGVICMSGMYSLTHLMQYPTLFTFLNMSVFKMKHGDPDSVKDLWPTLCVNKEKYNPKFLVTVAELDWFIEDHACAFIKKLLACNVVVQCKKLPGTTHITVNKYWDDINNFILHDVVNFACT